MNITNEFLFTSVGHQSAERLLHLKSAKSFIGTFIIPWVAVITIITNMVVSILSAIIYLKTKKKNHKPAFVFIGFLALFDMFEGCLPLVIALKEFLAWNNEIIGCQFFCMSFDFLHSGSLYTLLALTLDRYIFIKRPLHYPLIMTQNKTWLFILTVFLLAISVTFVGGLVVEFPPDEHICPWTHIYPSWFQVTVAVFYLTNLITIMVIYAVMLIKFRRSRKRLESIEKSYELEYKLPNLTFHQNIGIYRKKFSCEVASMFDEKVKTLCVKHLTNGKEALSTNKCVRKRRSSSVMKSLRIVGSHVRAATYILVLVSTVILCWAPFFTFCLYESITHLEENDITRQNWEDFSNSSYADTASIWTCWDLALQNKDCHMEMPEENVDEIKERIRMIFHLYQASNIHSLLGGYLALLNSMANPLLYAFWYPEFRKYLLQIPLWWKQKKPNPKNVNFEMY
eukprot:GFUD01003982.1.p1 GENE.GFUD01003982.1~~GFUD01003982.1.p1  ORF type:complete len:454 (+),score=45.61 GFUD01003982.1:460-1821(+)